LPAGVAIAVAAAGEAQHRHDGGDRRRGPLRSHHHDTSGTRAIKGFTLSILGVTPSILRFTMSRSRSDVDG
jgi:hypothetical protein